MFEKLLIKRCYRSKKDNLEEDFFIPLLKESVVYDRGTGYFSLNALSSLSKGVIPFVKKGGTIRIVTSVELSEEDVYVIRQGEEKAKDLIKEKLIEEINKKVSEQEYVDLDLITNLIAANILQIKIAYLPNGGKYHEKIGYFEDKDGNSIWFNGSTNETYNGLKKNVESLMVLKSWQGDEEEIDSEKTYFTKLWEGEDTDIEVIPFPEVAKENILKLYKRSSCYNDAILNIENETHQKEFEGENSDRIKKLYPYQEKAISEFISNGYHHFYEMATGTGKTYTAIKTIKRLVEDKLIPNLYVVVVVPQVDLQEQWKVEFEEEGIDCYLFGGNSSNKDLEDEFARSIINCRIGKDLTVVICVSDTYFSKLYNKIEKQEINKMLLIDEAHELNNNQMDKLSNTFVAKLGLSATPERHDKNETNRIISFFTDGSMDTYKYTIEDAINNEFLSRYEYYPIPVHMTESEFEKYSNYTKQLVVLLNAREKDTEKIQKISNNRSIVVKKAVNKIEKLKEMIKSNKYSFRNAVVYCGQGKDIDTEENIIDLVTKTLYDEGNYTVSQFTSKTKDRIAVLREFERGYYDTLVAIKCFDQGVDVPKLDKIFIMASDSLRRQTIQRRGRVLRKCKETGKNIAYIFDMVMLPPVGIFNEIGVSSLVANELKRVNEYACLAENISNVEIFIDELINDYNIEEATADEEEY